jgi:RNA polymerase sigma-70 factor (ECF subfamily)
MRLSAEEAFTKYADRMFAAAFAVCRNRMDADDAVQDTLIKYHSLRKDFEDENHLKAWLLRVVINRAKDISASFWRRNKVPWEDYMTELAFEAPEDSRLFEAVMRLPDKYRTVIHLFYYEDYSIQEIAAILKSREGTVKSQLSRGRELLKTMLKEEWDDDE